MLSGSYSVDYGSAPNVFKNSWGLDSQEGRGHHRDNASTGFNGHSNDSAMSPTKVRHGKR